MKNIINDKISFIANQKGSSLLEVMIALFVLAIGLLGTLAMQTESMKHNQNSYALTQSIFFANDLVERLRANNTVNASSTDFKDWTKMVSEQLPGGVGSITNRDAEGYRTIKIEFVDKKNKDAESTVQVYELKARI